MPAWVRLLQPLLSGVFTVDNLDYVRRDAFFTGVRVGIDVERLRRYAFVSERGLTLYEPGVAALEGFLGGRLLLHQAVYFHRTVRAIDLDLAEVFQPAIEALFGDDSPAERLADYVDLDEYALLHQAARWARGEDVVADGAPAPGIGRVSPAVADGWRGILLRRPGWRAEAEMRASYEAGAEPAAEIAQPRTGRARAGGDRPRGRRRAAGRRDRLASRARRSEIRLAEALARVPGFALIGRRYRRV